MFGKIKDQNAIFKLLLLVLDMLIAVCSFGAALLIRFDLVWSAVPHDYWIFGMLYMPIHIAVTVVVFYIFRLYHMVWRFISVGSMIRIGIAVTIASVLNTALSIFLHCRLPVSVYFIMFTLNFSLSSAVRVSFRFFTYFKNHTMQKRKIMKNENVMIIGAGQAGSMLIKELMDSGRVEGKVCCIIDDNSRMHGDFLKGIPIVGGREDIQKAVKKYKITMIIFAIPTASSSQKKEILNICKLTNCSMRTVPGIYQLVNNEVQISTLREVRIDDLLGREPVTVLSDDVMRCTKGQVIMITGGGGSIGSELCRQLAEHQPKQLIILDAYENNAYDIQMELKTRYPELDLVTLIASVRDSRRMNAIFAKYRPDIVYHAAAHKHVPLMEDSPNEAVKNNVFGTLKTARAAMKYNTKRFVLISTDKAVNPTNIMGATKRICEMMIQSLDKKSSTEFVAVRFGNVLGSNGSVIPLFKKQIEEGGPVKVTHPEMIRYFMTIPEAVSLVLQAGTYAKGGEIFVLDMGEPVKILDLAENLIRLSGYTPYTDIPIVMTGLRPGEKLYEEMLMEEEGLQDTQNHLIHIGKPIQVDEEKMFSILDVMKLRMMDDSSDIRAMVKEIVPTYQYNGQKTPEELQNEMEEAAVTQEKSKKSNRTDFLRNEFDVLR